MIKMRGRGKTPGKGTFRRETHRSIGAAATATTTTTTTQRCLIVLPFH